MWSGMTWFEQLTGCSEDSPEAVRRTIHVEGDRMTSTANGCVFGCGRLSTPMLGQLWQEVTALGGPSRSNTVRERVADVRLLHADAGNAGAMFQVASQFNLLEMVSPDVSPEDGVGRYELDHTQGPACAIAAGAGTIYRNYFAEFDSGVGQTKLRQMDCLKELGGALGNEGGRLWRMENGYALASAAGLEAIAEDLAVCDESQRHALRSLLRVGVHDDVQVTLEGCEHHVSQIYCSALPVRYSEHSAVSWEPFARLILEAAYDATLCAARRNMARTGSRRVFLTLLGGDAFGNDRTWIFDAMRAALQLHAGAGLEVEVVSYQRSNPHLTEWLELFA